MSKKFSCRRCFLTAIVSVATVTIAAGSASADTLGYFWGVNVSANGGDSLSPQFDPSLGTLQSVTLTAFALVMPDPVYLQNQNPEVGGTVSVTTTVGWGLFAGEDRMNLVSSGGSVSASGSVAPFGSGSGNMMPPPDTFVELMPSVSTPSQTTTLYSGFADFVGNGSVALDGEVDVQTLWTSDPASLSLVWTNAPVPGSQPSGYISGTLLYTFSPVPEPCTLVLLGIGAVSLLAYAWRRRTTKP